MQVSLAWWQFPLETIIYVAGMCLSVSWNVDIVSASNVDNVDKVVYVGELMAEKVRAVPEKL